MNFASIGFNDRANEYAKAIDVFRKAGEGGRFFPAAYGYAVFPTAGKAGTQCRKGFATSTVAKGGLVYEAAISGQRFTYKAH